jgi:hypothetical protein
MTGWPEPFVISHLTLACVKPWAVLIRTAKASDLSMRSTVQNILLRWHRFLRLPQHPRSWYKDRLREEICERRLARTTLEKLSETADVFYVLSRAQYDGHAFRKIPAFTVHHFALYAYLLSKYTSRWQFYRLAAFLCNHSNPLSIREVVNPSKDLKVQEVARRHSLEPIKFIRVCRRLRMVWPLLP